MRLPIGVHLGPAISGSTLAQPDARIMSAADNFNIYFISFLNERIPTLAVFLGDVLVGGGIVGDMLAVPFEDAALAGKRRNVAQADGLREGNSVFEIVVGLAPFADGGVELVEMLGGHAAIVEIVRTVDARHAPAVRARHEAVAAVMGEPEFSLGAHEENAVFVERIVLEAVLLLGLENNWRNVEPFALVGDAVLVDVLLVVRHAVLQPVPPVERDVAVGIRSRKDEFKLVAVSPSAFQRKACIVTDHLRRILEPQRPERNIHDVHAEVADRSVAVADPAVPAMRMHPVLVGRIGVEIADGRAAAPEIPVHPLGRRNRGRTLVDGIAPVVVRPDFLHFAERAFLDALDAIFHRWEGVPVSAALGDDAGAFARFCEDKIALGGSQAQGLVEIDVNAAAERHHRRQTVLMVGSLHDDSVDFPFHLIEHVLIRGKAPGAGVVLALFGAARLGDILVEPGKTRRIGIYDRNEILAKNAIDHRMSLKSATDERDADFISLGDLTIAGKSEIGTTDIEKRHRAGNSRAFEKIPACNGHFKSPLSVDVSIL